MKKTLYFELIAILLVIIILISGCTPEQEQELKEKYEQEIKTTVNKSVHEAILSINESKIICNPPYIRYAESCCLDVNTNSICDSDEKEEEPIEEPEETPPQEEAPEDEEEIVEPEPIYISDKFNSKKDYSTIKQGNNGWFYMYYDFHKQSYEYMERGTNIWNYISWKSKDGGCVLIDTGNRTHPHYTCDSVLAWRSPFNKEVKIYGTIKKLNTAGGDGINVKLIKNQDILWQKNIAYHDETEKSFILNTEVKEGDMIYLKVNMRGSTIYDTTFFDVSIEEIEEDIVEPEPIYLSDKFNSKEDFSIIRQGNNGWFYMYYDFNTESYKYMDRGIDVWGQERWKSQDGRCIFHNQGIHTHPHQTCDSVLSWRSPFDKTVRIFGRVASSDTGGGDGTYVKLLKNNNLLWESDVPYNDKIGKKFDLQIDIEEGDIIYLRTNKKANELYDSTFFNVSLEEVQELEEFDSVLSFDGIDDSITISDTDNLTPPHALSISAWVYINSISWDDRTAIVNKYDAGVGDRAYLLMLGKNRNPDKSSVCLVVSQSKATFNGKITCSNTQLSAGKWYHIVVTFKSNNQVIYINGVKEIDDRDTKIADSIPNNNQPLYIGYFKTHDQSENSYFNGYMNEIAIYNKALSQVEVNVLYNDGASYEHIGDEEGLIVFW
ncbi:MAG: LamG domain-containing protein [Nanoarchaeota archaeon]|nr:LamG domain-containing protein [Nanoarchaeota archaeon]